MKLAQALGLSHNVPADSPTVAVISSLETYHFEVFLKAHSIEGSQPLAAKGTGFGSLMLSLIEVIDCPFPCESVVVILDWEDFIPGLSFRSSRNVTTDADDLTPNSLACLFDQLVSLSKYKRLILVPPVMATVPDPGIPPMLVGPLDGLKQDVLKSLIDLEARVAGIELLQMPNVLGTLAPKEWTSEELLFKGGWPYTMGATTLIAATVFDRIRARDASKKILITDLDNTLWRGIAGEDGPGNVSWEPAEATYKHLVYQRLLNRFIERGVLVAVCS